MQQDLEYLQGLEVLNFEGTELTKTEGDKSSFITVGTLSVLYFKELDRFMLWLGQWDYALLKRLQVTGSGSIDASSRWYNFPSHNGFFTLKMNKIAHIEAIQNFETILSYNTTFFHQGQDVPVREGDMSPVEGEDEMYEGFSDALAVSQEGVAPEKRLRASDKIKRSFAKITDKLTRTFAWGKKTNVNLTQLRDIDQIKISSEDMISIYKIPYEDVQESIMINRRMPRISIQKPLVETIKAEHIHEKSDLGSTVENSVVETVITENDNETQLLSEIERLRIAQEEARRIQEEHKRKELESLEKERELQEAMRAQQEGKVLAELRHKEEMLESRLELESDILFKEQRELEIEREEFEVREAELLNEINNRLNELRLKEKLTEEEHAEFARREIDLVNANKRIDIERMDFERRIAEIKEQARRRELEIAEKERLAAEQKRDYELTKEELETQVSQRLAELREKEKLTEEERVELLRREEEFQKMASLEEMERLKLAINEEELRIQTQNKLAELREKEMLTEAERLELDRREREVELEIESRLAQLRKKVELTEEERLEISAKEAELAAIKALTESERQDYEYRRKKFLEQASLRETELLEKMLLTEAERLELERTRLELEKDAVMTDLQRSELEAMYERILREAEKREAEIRLREEVTEAERAKFELLQAEKEAEISLIVAGLKEKHMATKEEMLELERREKELFRMSQEREIIERRKAQRLANIRQQETILYEKNLEIIEAHKQIQQEIEELEKELSMPTEYDIMYQQIMAKSSLAQRKSVETTRTVEKTVDNVAIIDETTTSG